MTKILIVDDDLGLQKILGISLQKYSDDFEVLFADNGEEAISILKHHNIDLLVTDIKMPKVDGLALLSHMSVNYPSTPCIVLTSYVIPGLENQLSKKIFRFLKKPVDPATLAGMIQKGLKQVNRDGALSGISVAGFMQIIEAEKKTCLLVVLSNGKKQGNLYFHKGVLYDAVCGNLEGKDAALQLIVHDDAQIDCRKLPEEKISRKINTGMQSLILEAMKVKDEATAETTGQKQEQQQRMLMESIQLCEGLHLKKAKKLLLELASQNPDTAQTWLWLSRTLTDIKQIRIALGKAYKLDPKHPDMGHDIRAFYTASKLGLEQSRRCPFCFAPIDRKATQCHSCRASLAINELILSKINEMADRRELDTALKRFERVLARELNIPVLFYAGLACLHLNDFNAALEYLEQLQQCIGPEENVFTPAVKRIVAFIASKQTQNEDEGNSLTQEPEVPPLEDVSGRKKVLVVEDSQTTRKVIKMTLQSNNFNVVEAEDGVDALTKINDEQPDLILLDVMLPKLDGYGILSVLKQNSELKGVPVIMLTSKDGLKDRMKGRFSSASAYLTKPFKPEVLIKTVTQYIQ